MGKQACAGRANVRRPSVGSAIVAGEMFLVSLWCCTTKASALLQLEQVPNRITNKRSATFTYVCTPLDVADGDGCDVKVRAALCCVVLQSVPVGAAEAGGNGDDR